jgi:hypothetical protein
VTVGIATSTDCIRSFAVCPIRCVFVQPQDAFRQEACYLHNLAQLRRDIEGSGIDVFW